jgi:hypothetical protein
MEEWIRAKIEKVKKRIAEVERKITERQQEGYTASVAYLEGLLLGLHRELETLDDVLFAWEQQQKYGDVNHLL